MSHHLARRDVARMLRALWLVVAVILLATSAEAAPKKGKRKGKAKKPAAVQPATPATDTAPGATPAPVTEAAPATRTEVVPASAPVSGEPAPARVSERAEQVAPSGPPPIEPAPSSPPAGETLLASEQTPPPAASIEPAAAEPASSGMKLRLGANVGIMYFVPGPSYGANFCVRAGLRLTDLLGAYLDVSWGLGFGGGGSVSGNTSTVHLSAAGYRRVAVMGELTWGWLFFAVGPAFAQGTWGGVKSSGGVSQAYAADGNFPGAVARLGLQFGSRNRFTVALEGTVLIGKVSSADQTAAGSSVKTGDMTLGYSPVLMLGWDMN